MQHILPTWLNEKKCVRTKELHHMIIYYRDALCSYHITSVHCFKHECGSFTPYQPSLLHATAKQICITPATTTRTRYMRYTVSYYQMHCTHDTSLHYVVSNAYAVCSHNISYPVNRLDKREIYYINNYYWILCTLLERYDQTREMDYRIIYYRIHCTLDMLSLGYFNVYMVYSRYISIYYRIHDLRIPEEEICTTSSLTTRDTEVLIYQCNAFFQTRMRLYHVTAPTWHRQLTIEEECIAWGMENSNKTLNAPRNMPERDNCTTSSVTPE